MSEKKAIEVKKVTKTAVDDVEFEEFPMLDWPERSEEEEGDVNVWEDNWDDETNESEFSQKLKTELDKLMAQRKQKPTA
ncbi:unnamed protein product, partial [Mesorhabditis belari]|uniref:26S proteasome complex subunit dss-1 n=1 Tax=Mesorhabditis belari TaxID=2138241 RepID=A0AAF3FGS9_9BILA